MYSPLFDVIANRHRIWIDADPDGSAGGWSAEKVQTAVPRYITQAEADEIIATGGHIGVLTATAAPAG